MYKLKKKKLFFFPNSLAKLLRGGNQSQNSEGQESVVHVGGTFEVLRQVPGTEDHGAAERGKVLLPRQEMGEDTAEEHDHGSRQGTG